MMIANQNSEYKYIFTNNKKSQDLSNYHPHGERSRNREESFMRFLQLVIAVMALYLCNVKASEPSHEEESIQEEKTVSEMESEESETESELPLTTEGYFRPLGQLFRRFEQSFNEMTRGMLEPVKHHHHHKELKVIDSHKRGDNDVKYRGEASEKQVDLCREETGKDFHSSQSFHYSSSNPKEVKNFIEKVVRNKDVKSKLLQQQSPEVTEKEKEEKKVEKRVEEEKK